MRYITIKAFKFDELSEKAKENARENYRRECECDQLPWADENSKSIRKICKALNCSYEIDSYNHCDLEFKGEEEALLLEGARAYAYVWNNFIEPNLTGKFYAKGKATRRSKVQMEYCCPFTGYQADMILWEAFMVWKDDLREFETTVECFLNRVGYAIKNFLDSEEEYYDSDEYVEDMIIANDYEFTEDGEIL